MMLFPYHMMETLEQSTTFAWEDLLKFQFVYKKPMHFFFFLILKKSHCIYEGVGRGWICSLGQSHVFSLLWYSIHRDITSLLENQF